MKQNYTKPTIQIFELSKADLVLTTSGKPQYDNGDYLWEDNFIL